MSLKHALLGFLNYGPMTGYELKKLFDPTVGHFWNAELSQIYPTLKQLEAEGLAEMQVEVQADRPNRKVYSITDDGRHELLEWLAQSAETDQVREPLNIKLFFGAALGREELVQVLRHHADELRPSSAGHDQVRVLTEKFAEAVGLQGEAFFWGLTVDHGVKHGQASLDWLEETIRKIEHLDDSFFAVQRPDTGTIDVRRAMEMLGKLKSTIPEAFIGSHLH